MRAAIYAGSFDPVSHGHLSVIARAAELFDRLSVVVAHNPGKEPLFSVGERVEMLREVSAAWPNCQVMSTGGYVVELARQLGARYLVRGLRGVTDTEAELGLAQLNHQLAPEIQTVFVPAHAELSQVSSSRLKQLAREGADLTRYCPERVATRLSTLLCGQNTEQEHV